jgi:site-specific recombinase XerD
MRDKAMMLLFASTGLRSRELRQLELSDIRWKSGELLLRHTKGHRDRVVPLLDEVGAAVAEYVLRGRPKTTGCRVFLIHVPPVRPFRYNSTVARIVLTRLQSAGVSIERGGAHLLRHSLATRLVEQRRPIKEIADLLGHRNIDATSLYVKVALPQLVDVALPFPGGER